MGVRQRRIMRRGETSVVEEFKNIDEEMAYYLGVLLGDGNILDNDVLQLRMKDREPVEGLAKRLGFEVTVLDEGRLFDFRIMRQGLKEVLAPWGIVPRKSSEPAYPSVPHQFLIPYLRGLFDADGSYHYRKGHKGQRSWEQFVITFSVNEVLADFVQNSLLALAYTGNVRRYHRPAYGRFFEVTVKGRRQVEKLGMLLDGMPRLERKWARWEATAVRGVP